MVATSWTPCERQHVHVVRRDGARPDNAAIVVALLDDRGKHPAGADAVTPHQDRVLDRLLVEVRRIERNGVERPELEDVPDFDRRAKGERAAAAGASVALAREPDVRDPAVEVPATFDAAQVVAGAVRSGDELPLAQGFVDDHLTREAHGAERAGLRAERLTDLVDLRRTNERPEHGHELRLVETVVAADERQHDLAVGDDRHRLRRRGKVDAEEARESLARRDSGVSTSAGAASASGNSGGRGTPCVISRSAA